MLVLCRPVLGACLQAGCSIALSASVVAIFVVSSLLFHVDVKRMVVEPIDRMMTIVKVGSCVDVGGQALVLRRWMGDGPRVCRGAGA